MNRLHRSDAHVRRNWSLDIGHWSLRRPRPCPPRSSAGFVRLLVLAFAVATAFTARAASLTLDDAIRLALANNQRVKVSAFSPDIARANLLAEYGRFDPALTFRRSYSENEFPVATSPLVTQLTQTDDYSLALDGTTPWGLTYSLGATANNERGTFNRFSDSFITFGGVSITQPLLRGFGFGAGLAGVRVAKANRGISDWQHRQTVIDTVTSVILAYNNLVQARDNLRIARLSRELAAQLLSDNEKRNRIGSLSDADVTQARARVANREESILFAERSARDIENQLRLLLGESAFANTGAPIEITPLAPAADAAVNPADDLKRAYDLRPDYQAARLGVTIQRANQALAQNQLLPRVDFVGSYGYNGNDRDFAASRAQVRHADNRAYSAGVVVRVPLALAEGRGRARAAKLSLRQTEADLSRLEQDIAVAVTAAAGQIETTGQRVAATLNAYELAKQALDAEQKRFRAGTSTTFFVLQLQEQLSAVESGYYRALADQRRAIANYQRELGTTLAKYNIKLE